LAGPEGSERKTFKNETKSTIFWQRRKL